MVGLGYVGLPLAVAFAKHYPVIGYDIDTAKIADLQHGHDASGEAGDVANSGIQFTSDSQELARATCLIVAVPTPLLENNQPDLSFLEAASKTVGAQLKQGMLVVYESTVFPGCTEEVCLPLLEAGCGLTVDSGFQLAYSPERVNPGDPAHGVQHVTKVVSGHDAATLERVANIYGAVTKVFRATSIAVAEASKIVENIQRNVNIALTNELALIFARLKLNTRDVLAAAATKWNFHRYQPGLVGGYCIPVSPHYLTHRASRAGYETQVIGAGLAVNAYLGRFVTRSLVTALHDAGKATGHARVLLLGLTFKPGVSDHRHSRVIELIEGLSKLKVEIVAHEPMLSDAVIEQHFSPAKPTAWPPAGPVDAVVIFSWQRAFDRLTLQDLRAICAQRPILYDLPWRFTHEDAAAAGFTYLTL